MAHFLLTTAYYGNILAPSSSVSIEENLGFEMSDYLIFRFQRIDKNLLKSLVNSELFFARPDRLNDPFDCRVDILSSLKNAVSRANGMTRNELQQLQHIINSLNMEKLSSDLGKIGVCSFSLELENTLMWAHYADNHRGVCLTYEFPKCFFDESAPEILGIVDVDYGLNPLSDWFLQVALEHNSLEGFVRDLIKKVLTVKAELWKYEKEVRILRREEGVQVIDRQYLKQICFGLKSTDSDIALLRNTIRQCGYGVEFCKMVRSTSSDFGFEPAEI